MNWGKNLTKYLKELKPTTHYIQVVKLKIKGNVISFRQVGNNVELFIEKEI